jgi:hypothetical protein
MGDVLTSSAFALVRAIEALKNIKPSSPVERVMAAFLLPAYRRCLRATVPSAPGRVMEDILSASELIEMIGRRCG